MCFQCGCWRICRGKTSAEVLIGVCWVFGNGDNQINFLGMHVARLGYGTFLVLKSYCGEVKCLLVLRLQNCV